MEKTIHKTGFCLFVVVALSFLSPWAISCADSTSKTKAAKAPVSSETGATMEKPPNDEPDCVRGEPEPVLKNSKFRRLTPLTAEEEYLLNENISLEIAHYGCAHFAQSYRFKIKEIKQTKQNWRYWMNYVADRFDSLPSQDDSTRIKRIASVLRAQAKSTATYDYNTEISLSEAEFLTFDAKPAGKDSVEIVVSYVFIL